ncbi:AMIN-like domain-containing (lipo)protein [Pseudactinotalea sp.]|uniref:AMIN-like domain-containing (lipo)protein n=1 Tax=Pseudactinotalea sp. TaxID=1926260 RepID=UPI003B3BB130
MKRTIAWVLGLLLSAVLIAPATAAPAEAASPYCGITWGSLAKIDRGYSHNASLLDARAGRHSCFDRLVLDVRGDIDGYDLRYVTTVYQEGSGRPVPVAGGADLQIVLRVPVYDGAGHVTFRPASTTRLADVSGFRTFEQVAYAGSFEGQTTIALGVRARLPFRVFVLDGPGDHTRLVIDVAHRW